MPEADHALSFVLNVCCDRRSVLTERLGLACVNFIGKRSQTTNKLTFSSWLHLDRRAASWSVLEDWRLTPGYEFRSLRLVAFNLEVGNDASKDTRVPAVEKSIECAS